MAEKTVSTAPQNGEANGANPVETRDAERYLVPPVDIYETEQGLTVVADLPGVENKDVDIRVDDGVLTIQARTSEVAQANAVYSEFQLANFFRQFQLSEEVDQDKISAELRHGVLTLQLPRAEKAKPRKVEIKVG